MNRLIRTLLFERPRLSFRQAKVVRYLLPTAVLLVFFNGCTSAFEALSNLPTQSLSSVSSDPSAAALYPSLNFLASDSALPADAGILNVKDARFGAVGDGVHDDTDAIISAIDYQARAPWISAPFNTNFVYMPPGTYLVTDTIQKILARASMDANAVGNCATPTCYASGLVLIGAGPDNTFIKLKDRSAAFADPANPKAVIFTASSFFDPTNNFNHAIGEGNDAYCNYVESLTVDVGAGNPGAIGIDYLGNNGGAIRSVVITAPLGSGKSGISMLRAATGPALIENVWVSGFGVGIDVAGLG